MRFLLASLFFLSLISCMERKSASINLVGSSFYIKYDITDAPSEKRIYVTFTNNLPHAVCLGPGSWPSNGILINNGDGASLKIDGRYFSLEPEQDYCPKCGLKVRPKDKAISYFKYESFNLPVNLMSEKKELTFHPLGHRCR